MGIQAKYRKEGDAIIINVNGRIDYENQVPLKEELRKMIKRNQFDTTPKKLIFNFENLEFVGSSGITQFLQILKGINSQTATPPKYCNFKSEFKKMIQAFESQNEFEIFESEAHAISSYDSYPPRAHEPTQEIAPQSITLNNALDWDLLPTSIKKKPMDN